MSKLYLHCCCGPCCAGCIGHPDLPENREPLLVYSNSNLDSREEFDRRLEALQTLAAHLKLKVLVDPYDHAAWLEAVRGLESEPEHGKRCEKCFQFSLTRTAAIAGEADFATTLTVSPAKNSATIFTVGKAWQNFLPLNFKKKDGYRRGTQLAAELGLYRQKYCGCEFSRLTKKPDAPGGAR